MIAEVGLAALWLAGAMAALQLGLALGLGGAEGRRIGTIRAVALGQAVLSLIAFTALIALFMRTDLGVLLVADNSRSDRPWLSGLAGAWSTRQGAMLLWVTVLALAGAVVSVVEQRLDERLVRVSLSIQAALTLGFFALLLAAAKPFERLDPAPVAGRGLDPLLQNAGLAFHLPALYLGYAGLSVALSLAAGALVTRAVGPALARAMRPWVLGAWMLLTLAIAAGSYRAYREPGPGDWWSWDPAAISSLMAWLAATVLLHRLGWRRDSLALLPRLAPGVIVALATLAATIVLAPSSGVLPRLGLALGAGLLPASLMPLVGRTLRRTPLATWGMCLAHLGMAVAILGMASTSAFTRATLASALPGERLEVGPWQVEFRSVVPVAGTGWTALEGELRASRGDGVAVLKPQSRYVLNPPTTIGAAAIESAWNGQLYAVLGAQEASGRWQVRLWWKPFVTLIWFGGMLSALGGALALLGHALRARSRRRRLAEAE